MKIAITGGSRGIGYAVAAHWATTAEVWIGARNPEALQQAADRLGVQAHGLDVTDAASVAAFFAAVGPLDALVHAAGTGGFSDLADPADPALFQQVVATDLTGAYLCNREALKTMVSGGRIVNIASSLGLRGMRNAYAYCAAKHGLVGLTRALALDVAERHITVNAVCPGWVDTAMGHGSMAQIAAHHQIDPQLFIAAELEAIPLGRWIAPEEVAAMVAYLLSPAAAAVTGQALEISGGL